MTAREMFEDLGFEYQEDNYYISYNKKTYSYMGLDFDNNIYFNKKDKYYKAYSDYSLLEIDMLTTQAIIKQCEELGWL